MRYHVMSIAAVFLALAVGVVLGSAGVSDRLLATVSARTDDLSAQVAALQAERDTLAAAQRASAEFAERTGPSVVRGLLAGSTVTLVTAGADPADRDAVRALLQQSGAVLGGEVALTGAVWDPGRADQLRALTAELLPAGAQLPAASDTGSLVGGLLSSALVTPSAASPPPDAAQAPQPRPAAPVDPAQTPAVLDGLAAAGFVETGPHPRPGNTVLVLTGGAFGGIDGGDAAAVIARFAAQLDRAGGAVVLAGRTGSADAAGAVGLARAEPEIAKLVTTVDDVHSGAGRVTAVLGLREQLDGRSGAYGVADSATDGSAPSA